MKKYNILFVLVSAIVFSCKPKIVYDKSTYDNIMNKSIQLHAIQQKGMNNPGRVVSLSDTLYTNEKLPKEVVDSINNARKLEYRKIEN